MLNLKRNTVLLVFVFCVLWAQSQTIVVPPQADSLRTAADTTILRPQNLTKTTAAKQIVAEKDTASLLLQPNENVPAEVRPFKPDPKKAVLYSAIFPGLGQIYNRKYWKLPILYGGFAGLAYAITWNNNYYRDYFSGYGDIMDNDDTTNSWHNFIPYGQTPDTVDKNWLGGVLRDRKNFYRYYRDLSIIIAVAVYGLGIVDAYVDAQLYEFDVSPDLSMRLEPVIMKNRVSNNYLANSIGLRCSFTF